MAEPDKTRQAIRRLLISEVIIVAVLGGCYLWYETLKARKPEVKSEATPEKPLPIDTYTAQNTAFRELLSGFGTARAETEVTVAAQVSGEITEIHKDLKAGEEFAVQQRAESLDSSHVNQLLIKIDPSDYEQQCAQASSRVSEADLEVKRLGRQKEELPKQLKSSEAVLKALKKELEIRENAFAKNALSQSELNRAILDLERHRQSHAQLGTSLKLLEQQIGAAVARLTAAEAEASRLTNIEERTNVKAPFSGVVSEVFVDKGRFVRAGDQLIRFTDPTTIEVPVALPESWSRLQQLLSSPVELAPNETAETKWRGALVRVAPEADTDSRTVQCFVKVDNREQAERLIPGAFVHARISGKTRNAILVPRECVVSNFVYVVTEFADTPNDKPNEESKQKKYQVERREVTTGRTYQSLVEITDGLTDGEQIVMTNLDIVKQGMRVEVESNNTIESKGILPANNQSLRLIRTDSDNKKPVETSTTEESPGTTTKPDTPSE